MGFFAEQLQKFAKDTADLTDAVVRGVVMEVGTRLVERSPVGDGDLWKRPPPKGYTGGRFRANWQYGNYSGGGIPLSDLPDIDPTGQTSLDRIAQGLPKNAAGMRHLLINNLPYAQALEDGHSSQAPAGMVGLVQVEFEGIVRDVVEASKK